MGRERNESILAVIAALGGPVPRVLLRDIPSEDTPVVTATATRSGASDRYQVLGEIARGGVGVVLKSRDVDLGRDVAMKVIRPEHARNPEIVRRFVEEAQIGGQLQHPGIVPVYELGLQEDRRAFFTMKLVKGRTLSALLRERGDPSRERRRFLAIFEQVCQTMAYAHSRGVVHRDLKPSNVMVGAFGEVQVFDWGFAKVLARREPGDEAPTPDASMVRTARTGSAGSESQAGSVMGTPAYMPPEQALGQIEKLDERADVFALGAILCEILTGRPPYVPESGDLILQAAKHELADAEARLEACGADRDLVELARACLGVRGARPKDAGAVAGAVSAHLASVVERMRRAEEEAAKARVRTAEERRRRRLTVALTAAVVQTVLVGGGAYGWFEKERLDRVQANTVSVKGAIGEAQRLEVTARASAGDARSEWEQAALAARKARDFAGSLEIDPSIVAAADEVLARIEKAREKAKLAAVRAARNAEMVARLDGLREQLGDRPEAAAVNADYAAAFREHGIDVARLEASEAARRIRSSDIVDELCTALDAWAFTLERKTEADASRARGLLAVTAQADPDPWRKRLRRAAADGDAARLKALAAGTDPSEIGAASALLLGQALAAATDLRPAIAWLRQAQPCHPDDFWINLILGTWLHVPQPEPRLADSIAYLRAALAIRPESVEARHHLGLALAMNDQWEPAIALWQDALRLKPDYVHLYVHIIEGRVKLGRLNIGIADLEEALRAPSTDAKSYWKLGVAFRIRRRYGAAIRAFRRAVEVDPDFDHARKGLGYCLWQNGRLDKAITHFRRYLEHQPADGKVWRWLGDVYRKNGQVDEAVEPYRTALRIDPELPENHCRLALVGRPDEAMRAYDELRKRFQGLAELPDLEHDLAYAYERAALCEQARTFAQRAVERYRRCLERQPQGGLDGVNAAAARALQLSRLGGLLCDILGRFDEAIACFDEARRLEPQVANYCYNLGIAHGHKGDLHEAAKWFAAAVERAPGWVTAHESLADRLLILGEFDRAIVHYRKVLELNRNPHPTMPLMLGFCLLYTGQADEGLRHLKRFHEMAPWPEGLAYPAARWAEECAAMARLAPRTEAILKGDFTLASAREKLLFAMLWTDGAPPTAARYYAMAFADDPSLADEFGPWRVWWRHRTMAAKTALEAAMGRCGVGAAPDAETCARWRAEALQAMRTELEFWERRLDAGENGTRERLQRALEAWGSFKVVRGGDALAALPDEEQAAWAAFWDDVNALVKRARDGTIR